MKVTVRSKSGLVYVAEVSDHLRDQAEILLGQIAGKEPEVDNGKVRLDWGLVKLVRHDNQVVVEEPNYKKDPLSFVPGLNFTCAVLRVQQSVHDRLGVPAEPVRYDEFILAYPGSLSAVSVVAIRQTAENDSNSGWCVFDAAKIDWTAEPDARRVYEVAHERPALVCVLSLPVGWSVRIEQETLLEAAPPEGEPIVVGLPLNL